MNDKANQEKKKLWSQKDTTSDLSVRPSSNGEREDPALPALEAPDKQIAAVSSVHPGEFAGTVIHEHDPSNLPVI